MHLGLTNKMPYSKYHSIRYPSDVGHASAPQPLPRWYHSYTTMILIWYPLSTQAGILKNRTRSLASLFVAPVWAQTGLFRSNSIRLWRWPPSPRCSPPGAPLLSPAGLAAALPSPPTALCRLCGKGTKAPRLMDRLSRGTRLLRCRGMAELGLVGEESWCPLPRLLCSFSPLRIPKVRFNIHEESLGLRRGFKEVVHVLNFYVSRFQFTGISSSCAMWISQVFLPAMWVAFCSRILRMTLMVICLK